LISDESGIVEVSDEYDGCSLEFVYDQTGKEYAAEKEGKFICLIDSDLPIKGTYLDVVMVQNTVKCVERADCKNTGGGYYRVLGIQSRREGIDGLYHTAPGDIVKIGKITDANGIEYEAQELRTDLFLIKPLLDTEIKEPLTVENVEYIPPFLFALLSQNLSKEDNEVMVEAHGEAVLTFPYNCDVSDEDILTVLSGTYTQKEVVRHVEEGYDTIGAYFVTDIVSCIGNERDYKEGIDFLLVGTNYLKWICEDSPLPGDAYSLTYRICPTYKVVKSIPQLRTSENQRLPKKAIVQLFGTYAENGRANQQ
jgi:hypothetical protein